MARVQHTDVVIGAGAGVAVNFTSTADGTTPRFYTAREGGETVDTVLTNEVGYYSVWMDEGEYNESVPGAPREDRVITLIAWSTLQEATAVKEGPPGERGEKGDTGATGEPGAATGGYQTGDIRFAAASSLPTGWLACDGSAVSRTGETKALFEAVGTAFGAGDGSTTFNLPDFRGRVPMGVGKGASGEESETFPSRTLGGKAGALVRKLTAAQMPKHGHAATDSGHLHAAAGGQFMTTASEEHHAVSGSGLPIGDLTNTASAKANVTNSETGNSEAHDNVQPSTVVSVWIKK